MSTAPTISQEQQQQVAKLSEFAKSLKPAVLKDSHSNGYILAQELTKRGKTVLNASVEDLLAIVNAILFENKLEWAVEPVKLKAGKKLVQETAPEHKGNIAKHELEREQNARAVEKAAAFKKDQEIAEKEISDLIAGYFPVTRRGVLDNAKRDEVQILLREHVAKEKSRQADMREVQKKVIEYVQKIYAEAEKAAERI